VKQAEYLKHFRADNIVRDSEAVRQSLTADDPEENKKWSVLGQSFGGFCSVTYLSML
jgi:dienelactone hydrolase